MWTLFSHSSLSQRYDTFYIHLSFAFVCAEDHLPLSAKKSWPCRSFQALASYHSFEVRGNCKICQRNCNGFKCIRLYQEVRHQLLFVDRNDHYPSPISSIMQKVNSAGKQRHFLLENRRQPMFLHFQTSTKVRTSFYLFHPAKIESNHFGLLPFMFESQHFLKLNCLSHLSNSDCQITYTEIPWSTDRTNLTCTPFAKINMLSRHAGIQPKETQIDDSWQW